jgi:hypothetical protein
MKQILTKEETAWVFLTFPYSMMIGAEGLNHSSETTLQNRQAQIGTLHSKKCNVLLLLYINT